MTTLTPESRQPGKLDSPDLPKNPATQSAINEMFVQSGIGARMLEELHKHAGVNQTSWQGDVNDCNFGVSKRLGHNLDQIEVQMTIEYPNPDPTTRANQPRVETHMSSVTFSVALGEKPLTPDQDKVVADALKLQEAEKGHQ